MLPDLGLDPAADDLSISYAPAGSMLDHTGWFGESEEFVAKVHGADGALLVPAGSTVANHVVLRALARASARGVVLVDRQAHHSVVRGLNMFGVPWRHIDTGRWDDRFECPRPVLPQDVAATIRRVDEVAAVILVSPTYGGEIASLGEVREVIDRLAPSALLHVDEAWGAHLAFHPTLRNLSATRFADTVSQSTHKAGGALQPGAVLLWNDSGRLPFPYLDQAYVDLLSTSASFLIAASIDSAHRALAKSRGSIIDRSIVLTTLLADGLRDGLPGAALLSDERAGSGVAQDPTKVTVALPDGPVTGYAVRDRLAEQDIVVEKATPATLTFLTTFGLDEAQVRRTVAAVVAAVTQLNGNREPARRSVPDPFAGAPADPVLPPWDVQRVSAAATRIVPLDDAVGQVAADYVEAYPPGIAVISEGFEVTSSAVEWLRSVKAAGGTIVARDPDLATLRIVERD